MYHVMKDFHLCGWLLSYDLSKTSAKLVISLKHNIFFAKFCEILLDNNIIGYTHSLTKQKSFGSYLSLYFPTFYTRLDFRWLTKSIETIKLYKRSFSCCYSLCFYISIILQQKITSSLWDRKYVHKNVFNTFKAFYFG